MTSKTIMFINCRYYHNFYYNFQKQNYSTFTIFFIKYIKNAKNAKNANYTNKYNPITTIINAAPFNIVNG
jgi:hypothetical protein